MIVYIKRKCHSFKWNATKCKEIGRLWRPRNIDNDKNAIVRCRCYWIFTRSQLQPKAVTQPFWPTQEDRRELGDAMVWGKSQRRKKSTRTNKSSIRTLRRRSFHLFGHAKSHTTVGGAFFLSMADAR